MGHYNGETVGELEARQQSGKITLQQTVWLGRLQLFLEMPNGSPLSGRSVERQSE
jgi:hypothetical protein